MDVKSTPQGSIRTGFLRIAASSNNALRPTAVSSFVSTQKLSRCDGLPQALGIIT